MKIWSKTIGLFLGLTLATGISPLIATNKKATSVEAIYSPTAHYEVSDTAAELESYYSSISSSDSGTSLLSKLRTLNSTKRQRTVGKNSMGTSSSTSAYVYTDYVLGSSTKDSNGQVYGTNIASFYTKTSTTSFNKEHVWPDSKGGGSVEGDIHMMRPTITAENSSRGNSNFVEGMNSSSAGWDPYTAGYDKEMRGECARIILYCVVANSSLNLVANNTGGSNTMGNMNTLIKWHFDYSPNQYEINRNNGGEYLQGNRNPFIDHPEYVAKIWSNFNSTVSSICEEKSAMYSEWVPGSASTYGQNDMAVDVGTGSSGGSSGSGDSGSGSGDSGSSSTEPSSSYITMAPGTNGSTAVVNDKSAIKVGTSSKGGTMTVTVPAGTTKLKGYAGAWNGVSGLSINITGATVSPSSISLTSDSGLSNNSPFTLSGTESSYKFELTLSNISTTTTLTFTSSAAKRFVVWGVNLMAESFANIFMSNLNCNSSGTSEPTYKGSYSWTEFKNIYNSLDSVEKSRLVSGESAVSECIARYDYIVGKYNKGMGMITEYPDFIGRDPVQIGNSRQLLPVLINNMNNSTIVIIIVSLLSISSIVLLLIIKKKRQI